MYDRIWMPLRFSNHAVLNTSSPIDSNMNNDFQPPNVVMSTASTPWNESLDIILSWKPLDPVWKFYVYMHFAEVRLELPRNETENNLPTPLPQFKGIPKREFSVFWNKTKLFNAFSPRFLYTDTLFTKDPVTGPKHEFSLLRTANSTFPPSINAMEIYRVNEFLQSPTDQHDGMVLFLKQNLTFFHL